MASFKRLYVKFKTENLWGRSSVLQWKFDRVMIEQKLWHKASVYKIKACEKRD